MLLEAEEPAAPMTAAVVESICSGIVYDIMVFALIGHPVEAYKK